MASDGEADEEICVVCTVCRARLDERPHEKPRRIRCPDCFSNVRVPSRNEVEAARPRPAKPAEEIGIYRLLHETSGGPPSAPPRVEKPDDAVLVVCSVCRARMHPKTKAASYRVRCPDCHEPVRVPSREEAREHRRRYKPERKIDPVEPLVVPAASPRAETSTKFFEVQAEIRRETIDPPPKSTWFAGVWLFPWQAEVIGRWIYLSLGYTGMGLLAALLIAIGGGAQTMAGSPYGTMGGATLAFFALPAIWITLWTLSYAAACWTVVVIDTAAGNRRIHNWLEQNWREWILQLTYVGYIASLTLAAAHVLGKIVELLGGRYGWGFGPAAFLLFPIILLSSMQAVSLWIPLTVPILASLRGRIGGWPAFYGLSAILVFGWLTLWLAALSWNATLTLCAAGPAWSAVTLIHGRLLGRLGWVISRSESKRPAREATSVPR